jgi:ketosteroid isomerase-like protein
MVGEATMNDVFPPAVEPALREWHRIVASGDLAALPALLHPDVVFRSPAAFRPYRGAPTVALILRTVFGVFSGFAYERQFAAGEGFDVALEFRAQVGEKQLKGIDLIRFDADGRIVEFEVMIRPASGLAALAGEMGRRLAAAMPADGSGGS